MDHTGPLISVLMNCYNGERYLADAIESVIGQTYPNWELIFWDNQSTDRSPEICGRYGDPRIKYFRSRSHTNLGAARALALERARGKIIGILDTDDLWLPRKLEQQLPLFDDPTIGIVICDVIFFNNHGHEKQLYDGNPPPQRSVFFKLIDRYFISLETVLLRKSAIDALDHAFDGTLSYISDFDLIVRLSQDWRLAYVPEVLCKWRVHSDSLTWREPSRFNIEKAQFVRKMDSLYPDASSNWQKARNVFVRNLAFQNALTELLREDNASCRKQLSGFVFSSWKSILLYVLSFLPHSAKVITSFQQRAFPHGQAGNSGGARSSRPDANASSIRHIVLGSMYKPLRLANAVRRKFGIKPARSLRVLIYHNVLSHEEARFADQLRWLSRHWRFVSPDQFARMITGEEAIQANSLLLTFDDGYRADRYAADRVLKPLGIRALFFVTTDFLDPMEPERRIAFMGERLWPGDKPPIPLEHLQPMDWNDVDHLLEEGHVVGSHSRTHARLSEVTSEADLSDEILASGDRLETKLGIQIRHFAFPFGNLASFSPSALAVARQRYDFIHTGLRGDNAGRRNPWAIRRDAVSPAMSVGTVGALLEGGADFRYARDFRRFVEWTQSKSEPLVAN